MRTAILCVGNRLMLDDGLGPAVYEQLRAGYELGDEVELYDVGCLSLDMIDRVRDFDRIITIDALDGTGEPAGTVLAFCPEDMARRGAAMQSLHELRLRDLFDTAALLGYESEGSCFGIQVENRSPAVATIGLTRVVHDAVPLLVDTVLADLVSHGAIVRERTSGSVIEPGFHHAWIEVEEGL